MIKTTLQTITLKGRIPSKKNSKRVFRTRGRTIVASSQAHQIWHREAWLQLVQQNTQKMATGTKSVHISFWFPDKRRTDLTNKAESIMDLLVDFGIIEDDNATICPKITLEYHGIDKANPRCEVIISAL